MSNARERLVVSVRSAGVGDREVLVDVWRRAVQATHAFLTAADQREIEELVKDALSRCGDLRVAVNGERVVGFVAVDGDAIEMLFVEPDVHGRGVGSALLDDATRGHQLTYVDVNEQNPSGRSFYRARGFTKIGRSPRDPANRPFPILHLLRCAPSGMMRPTAEPRSHDRRTAAIPGVGSEHPTRSRI